MQYIALVHKEEDSDYGVSFPDFPGCVTAGVTLEQAREMAKEAVVSHINLLKEMGENVPTPSSLEEVMASSDNKQAMAFLVDVPSDKIIRVNITVPEDVLNIVDRRAKRLHLSRSAFLVHAAMHYGKSSARKAS